MIGQCADARILTSDRPNASFSSSRPQSAVEGIRYLGRLTQLKLDV